MVTESRHHCPKCGKHTPMPQWDGKYCTECGTKQVGSKAAKETPRRCTICEYPASREAKYCLRCGAEIKAEPSRIPAYTNPT